VLIVLFFVDLAFGDSDAIWAQHSSGTFSQIDLRDCIKSVDLITSKAVTWEASGSLTFVTVRENPWQVPYDDV
jgi:WD repeat-containing protein 24